MAIDVAQARADTPGCEHVVHLNNAGAALPPQQVLDVTVDHLRAEALYGGYEVARDREADHEAVYASVARLIGAAPGEIALMDSATRAWDAVFGALRFSAGRRILTTTSEYGSNVIAYLQARDRFGVVVDVVPDAEDGSVDVGALASMVDGDVALISMNHVPTHSGLVNPAAEVGRVARAAGVPFLLDACQSVGQLPVDVADLRCDFLAATSRKFLRGPRGVGFLYVREGSEIEPLVADIHSAEWTAIDRYEVRRDARRFELWESSVALRLGFGAAVDYALDIGIDDVWQRVAMLGARLREELGAVAGVTVRDTGAVRGAIVTFDVAGLDAYAVRDDLRAAGINVSVSTVASARIDMERRGLPAVVRASVHYYNTEEELEALVAAVARLARSGTSESGMSGERT